MKGRTISIEKIIEVDEHPRFLQYRLGFYCPLCDVIQLRRGLDPSTKERIIRHELQHRRDRPLLFILFASFFMGSALIAASPMPLLARGIALIVMTGIQGVIVVWTELRARQAGRGGKQ